MKLANPARRLLGFTLIELLVVIFIVGIVTGVALLSFGRNEEREIKTFANELAQMLKYAQDRALLESKTLGFALEDHAFYFVTLAQDPDEKMAWDVIQDQTLSKREIPKNIKVSVQVANKLEDKKDEANATADNDNDHDDEANADDDANPHGPEVIIYNNSDFTPFTIFVGKEGHKPSYAILGQANGNLITKTLS